MFIIPLFDDSPLRGIPFATYALMLACAAIFLFQIGLPQLEAERFVYVYGMIPALLLGHVSAPTDLHGPPASLTLITWMFLHGSWPHLLGNMLYLWLFGRGVESAMGSFRFLVFYLACGVVSGLVQAACGPFSELPVIGASGAVAGVLGAYFILFPRGNVTLLFWFLVFFRIVAVRAVLLLGLWLLVQLLNALASTPDRPGIAFWAHVGGFLTGAFLVFFFRLPGVAVFQPARSASFAISRKPVSPWNREAWH